MLRSERIVGQGTGELPANRHGSRGLRWRSCQRAGGALSAIEACTIDNADGDLTVSHDRDAQCRFCTTAAPRATKTPWRYAADSSDYTQQDLRCQLTGQGGWDAILGRCARSFSNGTHRACTNDYLSDYAPRVSASTRAGNHRAYGDDITDEIGHLEDGSLEFAAGLLAEGLIAPTVNDGALSSAELLDYYPNVSTTIRRSVAVS